MTAIILSVLLLLAAPAPAAEAPAWVVLVYDCERPVGIMLNLDPPRWFPASGEMTPYVASLIDRSINADRVVALQVGQKCADRGET